MISWRYISEGRPRTIAAGILLAGVIGLIGLIVELWSQDPIAFHTREMHRAQEAMFADSKTDGGLVYVEYGERLDEYERHRKALVERGAIEEITATLEHIRGHGPEADHLSRLLLSSDQPNWGGPSAIDVEWSLSENGFSNESPVLGS